MINNIQKILKVNKSELPLYFQKLTYTLHKFENVQHVKIIKTVKYEADCPINYIYKPISKI